MHRWVMALCGVSVVATLAAAREPSDVASLFAGRAPTEGRVLIDPGVDEDAQSATSCAKCHRDVVDAWSSSRHAQAVGNPLFQSALQHEPKARCVRCHAPLTTETQAFSGRAPRQGVAAEGVNCAVCHLRAGKVLTTNPTPSALSEKSHPLRYAPEIAQSEFCGACHEFHFLNAQGAPTNLPIQSTYTEWLDYRARGGEKTCVQCHMRNTSDAPDASAAPKATTTHAFRGSHFLPLLESALRGEVTQSDAGAPVLELTAQNVGHNLPTGDLYRHLIVEVQRSAGAPFEVLTRLRREHRWSGRGATRQKRRVADTTLIADTPRRLPLPRDTIAVRVVYTYTSDENARRPELRTVRTRVPIWMRRISTDGPSRTP